MRRKLLIANVVLLALAAGGLWKFRADYRRALERYRLLQYTVPSGPAHGGAPQFASAPPVQPAAYLDAAEKFLFHQDRNPNVAVEAPKPRPRPTLPVLYGVMRLGGDPIAIMSVGSNTGQKKVRLGDSIGEFKLLAAAGDQITLEWEGQKIEAQVSDVLVKPAADNAAGGGAAAAAPAGPAGANVINPNAASGRGEYIIGAPMQGSSGTVYSSPAGDTAPAGTVYQGKRKVVRQTPFGTQSWWEDVKQ